MNHFFPFRELWFIFVFIEPAPLDITSDITLDITFLYQILLSKFTLIVSHWKMWCRSDVRCDVQRGRLIVPIQVQPKLLYINCIFLNINYFLRSKVILLCDFWNSISSSTREAHAIHHEYIFSILFSIQVTSALDKSNKIPTGLS